LLLFLLQRLALGHQTFVLRLGFFVLSKSLNALAGRTGGADRIAMALWFSG
jgi:hypothetical protein